MIRMTLLLMAGIVGAMLAWGDNEGLPQGSDSGSDVAATRAADSPGLLSRVGALLETPETDEAVPERTALGDERRAIEIALAATVTPDGPAVSRTRSASISATGEAPAKIEPTDEGVQATDGMWYVTGTTVNLRAGPSTSDSVVGRVRMGQRAEILSETSDGWFEIRTADDQQAGFIFGKFLSENRPG